MSEESVISSFSFQILVYFFLSVSCSLGWFSPEVCQFYQHLKFISCCSLSNFLFSNVLGFYFAVPFLTFEIDNELINFQPFFFSNYVYKVTHFSLKTSLVVSHMSEMWSFHYILVQNNFYLCSDFFLRIVFNSKKYVNILCMISILYKLFRLVFCPSICSVFVNVPHMHLKKICILQLLGVISYTYLYMSIYINL